MLNRREVLEAGMSAALAAICPPGMLGPELVSDEETSESSVVNGGCTSMCQYELVDAIEVTLTWMHAGVTKSVARLFRKPIDKIEAIRAVWPLAKWCGANGRVRSMCKHVTVRVYQDERWSRFSSCSFRWE